MRRTSVPFLGVALLLLVACDSGSGGDRSPQSPSSPSTVVTAQSPADPLEGDWNQTFTCEEHVTTVQRLMSETTPEQRRGLAKLKGNTDASVPTMLREFTREFAWGPNAKGPLHGTLTTAQIQPKTICKGAPDREMILRFFEGRIQIFNDWDATVELDGTYRVLDAHTFAANDGNGDLGGTPRFSFEIRGDELTIKKIGGADPWGDSYFEMAPFVRVT
jgi:hypothetical protein